MLKYAKAFLIKPLTLLINQTLSTRIFPNELKISRVRPSFKNGDTSNTNNYKPISLLPLISKIFKYAIFHQLFDYMSHNALFCQEQFGFRTGHSTELSSLHLTDYLIKWMDPGSTPLNIYIYIDLSKAFDTLDHSILLSKLSYYGITGCENKLFVSYLSNRHQYVECTNSQSVTKLITTGVPQCSILGPLLFLIYINDLPKVSAFFYMLMYADDTTIYCNIDQNVNEIAINAELEKVNKWLYSNKLSFDIKQNEIYVFLSQSKTSTISKYKTILKLIVSAS